MAAWAKNFNMLKKEPTVLKIENSWEETKISDRPVKNTEKVDFSILVAINV